MKCADCKFFQRHAEYQWAGGCNIKLPPHVQEPANNYDTGTREDNECDLGQAKQVEAEE